MKKLMMMSTLMLLASTAARAEGWCDLAPGWTVVTHGTKADNVFMYDAERITERFLTHPDQTDEPTCGPGPFSMANADTVTDQLIAAGFEGISLRRCDLPILG